MAPRSMFAALLLFLAGAGQAAPADRSERELDARFAETVRPFLETYCFACHGPEKQKGKLDLRVYPTRAEVARGYRQWEVLLEKLKAEEMPPEEAKRQPPAALRRGVIAWIQEMRRHEAQRRAGDPGPIFARRLSNAEYDYTIRDLTGVDIRPAREFPVDPANEAGFDNSGESLAMSSALLKKYLEASRQVAEHLLLKPEGFVFAPHPVVTETDRDKYAVKRIIDFYRRQPTDYADYFAAAWRFRHRVALSAPRMTLAECAAAAHVSPRYLATIWSALSETPAQRGPMAAVEILWRELPAPGPDRSQPKAVRRRCEQMRDFIVDLRPQLNPVVTNLEVRGIAPGSQPFVLWKDRQFAANRRRYAGGLVPPERAPEPRHGSETEARVQSALWVPDEERARARYAAECRRFCAMFPDAFYVAERGLIFLKEDKESQGRLLSAGFHLMTGYFRDDAPLSDLILDEPGRRELDRLWEEFHFITLDPIRQYKDFIFFERAEPPRFMQGAEFDFARSEDKDSTSETKIRQLAEGYLAKARRNGPTNLAVEAIQDYFQTISSDIRRVEQAHLAAEASHLQALQIFAERAYRRPLLAAERQDLLAFYRQLRDQDGLTHEEAMRDAVASVLMAPGFCYRMDLGDADDAPGAVRRGREPARAASAPAESRGASGATPAGLAARKPATRPLSDYALASRLSYFLWASMPDAELWARARAGDLHQPKVLVAQTRRLLQDDRNRGLATEFAGNWLDFRRFEEHNSVDRERFKSFNNELRQAMFEEPIRFFIDVVRRDRSILDFLEANDTFVNPVLARLYEMPDPPIGSNDWVRVDAANRYGRGGLLPMAVFLTKNAPGLRTSPVKRGYWVIRRLLGEQVPPPPPKVPELPSDEGKLGDLTLREVLARHREDKSCAACHARFDSIGLVFEGYGPIGERRTRDLGGRSVDIHATFPGGSEGAGLDGLRRYLGEHRQQEFLDNFCRKLLAYALGRTVLLSDDPLVDDMRAKLAANHYRFSTLVETIVTSPQFLNRRLEDE